MATENASSATVSQQPAVNPYWAEAQARLQSAGVGVSKPEVAPANYLYQTSSALPSYFSPYASVTMPGIADMSNPYDWYTNAAPPPQPLSHPAAPRQLRPQRIDNTRVPFNYSGPATRPQHQRFTMSFNKTQNGNVLANSNAAANAAVNDTLGDPNGGFFLRGRHPPSLKLYVSRALAHPKTQEERRKCEDYLYSKIEPLLLSGAVFHVRWENEPLPHEKNYELTTSWTPASKLKPNNSSVSNRRENRKSDFSSSRSERLTGPDILLVRPQKSSKLSTSPTPIVQRGNPIPKKNKKRQSMVDEFFTRTEDRFDPNDCDEIVGTCFEIEKKFFRLTKKPDASEIRPPQVLRKAFNRLQTIAKDPTKYKYVCDQLRAIRQDLTVQKIRDEFTVAVYEFHARLTLENKDLCEFNQCQSQLRHLYDDLPGCKNEYEFTAYRLLYYILTEDDQDILSLLNDLDSKARKSPSLSLAIKVHDAFLKSHHIRLLKLYRNTPRMCGNVMELFLDRERRRFVKVIKTSYHPVLEVSVLAKWFQFSSENEFVEYMKTLGIELQAGGKTEPKKWSFKS